MNDAEFLRKEARGWREEARERASHGDHDLQEEATQRADRLTALADRLDGGVIVSRTNLSETMAYVQSNRGIHAVERIRAMLTASGAK